MAYQVSERYKRSVTAVYTFAHLVEVRRAGVTVATGLRITEGSVDATATADVRRTCSLTVVGLPKSLVPTRRNRSPLDVYGNELAIHAGVAWPDRVELVPQGVFEITDSEVVDTAEGITASLSGRDRAGRFGDAKLLSPWGTAPGTSAIDAITDLAADRYPGLTIVDNTSAADTFPPHVVEEEKDPWAAGILVFARAVGAEAFFDRAGRLVVRDVPQISSLPVSWRFFEGRGNPAVKLSRKYSVTGAANAIVMKGENSSNAPVKAVAVDTDPLSPTYYGPDADNPVAAGFGPRPVFESSPLVTTTEQAQRAADAMLRQLSGATEMVNITAVPNHAVDPGDVVHVRRGRSGFDDVYVVDSVSVPLSNEGTMELACRVLREAGS